MTHAEQLKIIEKNHLDHFTFLPKNLGFDVREISGVTTINCGLQTSMFNIAYGSPKELDAIHEIKQAFVNRPFAWWIPPSVHNPEVTKALLTDGFIIENVEHAMICELSDIKSFTSKTDLKITYVINNFLLQDFISVLESYDPHVQELYGKVTNELFNLDEKLIVGYANEKPVAIGILFMCNNSAGIFSLITKENARGNGYGADMMLFLMKTAKDHGCHSVTLSASSDSGYRIYERIGFFKVLKCSQ